MFVCFCFTVTITTYDAVTDSPKSSPPIITCRNGTDLMQGVGPSANNRGARLGAALLKMLPKLQDKKVMLSVFLVLSRLVLFNVG